MQAIVSLGFSPGACRLLQGRNGPSNRTGNRTVPEACSRTRPNREQQRSASAQRVAADLQERYYALLERFVSTEPTTIRGVILKARKAKDWNDVGMSDTLDRLINGLAALDPDKLAAG